jgi:hypothetical protein
VVVVELREQSALPAPQDSKIFDISRKCLNIFENYKIYIHPVKALQKSVIDDSTLVCMAQQGLNGQCSVRQCASFMRDFRLPRPAPMGGWMRGRDDTYECLTGSGARASFHLNSSYHHLSRPVNLWALFSSFLRVHISYSSSCLRSTFCVPRFTVSTVTVAFHFQMAQFNCFHVLFFAIDLFSCHHSFHQCSFRSHLRASQHVPFPQPLLFQFRSEHLANHAAGPN